VREGTYRSANVGSDGMDGNGGSDADIDSESNIGVDECAASDDASAKAERDGSVLEPSTSAEFQEDDAPEAERSERFMIADAMQSDNELE